MALVCASSASATAGEAAAASGTAVGASTAPSSSPSVSSEITLSTSASAWASRPSAWHDGPTQGDEAYCGSPIGHAPQHCNTDLKRRPLVPCQWCNGSTLRQSWTENRICWLPWSHGTCGLRDNTSCPASEWNVNEHEQPKLTSVKASPSLTISSTSPALSISVASWTMFSCSSGIFTRLWFGGGKWVRRQRRIKPTNACTCCCVHEEGCHSVERARQPLHI